MIVEKRNISKRYEERYSIYTRFETASPNSCITITPDSEKAPQLGKKRKPERDGFSLLLLTNMQRID
jgi:hypothetical protein